LEVVPSAYEQLDTSRLTLLFFALSGLDVLGCVDEITPDLRKNLITWIYSLQIRAEKDVPARHSGFRGSFTCASTHAAIGEGQHHLYDMGHLAMTYTGLACLLILQDDLSRVDRAGVLAGVQACQLDDGSFCAHPGSSENDMRFVYCAIAICYMLQDFRSIDETKVLRFIEQSWNYDGGFAQCPGLESHGGSTYCAVASIHMLNRSSQFLSGRKLENLLRWCVLKQQDGFHGRPSKPDDSCYTFWLGATLKLLDSEKLVDRDKAIAFTCSTQDELLGGFGKYPDVLPDLLHTYMSLAGLAVFGYPNLQPVNPALNITQRADTYLRSIIGPEKLRRSSGDTIS